MERQYSDIADVAAVTAAAVADIDDDVVSALDAAAAVVILGWKCPAKTDEAFRNTRAKTAAVAPSFALLFEAAVAILSLKCSAKAKEASKNIADASFTEAKNTTSAPSFSLLIKTTVPFALVTLS